MPSLLALLVLSGCGGDGDGGFTADQFVGAMNQRGASLQLGPELPSTRTDAEVYALALGSGSSRTGGTHAGGSLAVMPSADAGLAEWERCEQAASLLCYRADNIVLLLEGEIDTAQRAALTGALGAIADETSD